MKLKPVKDFLKLILYVDPKIHHELFCSHPYTNSVIVYDGKNFMNLQNENDLQNFHSYILKRIDEIENVNDISLLGSAIYSRWRYFNHWAYDAAEILSMPNKRWFIIALNRLVDLCKDKQEN